MSDTLPAALTRQLAGLSRLPAHRQFGLVLGLAAVAAIGIALLLWGLQPRYQTLMHDADGRDVSEAIAVLDRNDIPHRLDRRSGALMVPASLVPRARLNLASSGLPRGQGMGFELLEQDTRLGTSRQLESARFQRALEGELARSIVTLDSVGAARVHLAMPRETVFRRDRARPSASVLVNLRPGRQLDETQVAGIVHLVAASVPELEVEQVTVVDQRGRMLSQVAASSGGAMPAQQLEYTRRIEDAYRQRVEAILAPLVGPDGLRVQITAEVDFTQVESTRETFDSSNPALRSEQIREEDAVGSSNGGVPGSLTNQPPAAATVAAANGDQDSVAGEPVAGAPTTRNRSSTRNFELDRTIDHIRHAPATLKRLSVAVVVDHRMVAGEDAAAATRMPWDAEGLAQLNALVREAVGLDEQRGDRLNVVNASFRDLEVADSLPETPLWQMLRQEPWVADAARYALATLGFLMLIMMVLRPALKSLAQLPPAALPATAAAGSHAQGLPAPAGAALTRQADASARQAADASAEQDLGKARQLATQDPRMVAQVVRQWMNEDGQ